MSIQNALDKKTAAFGKALDRVRKNTGGEMNPHIERYLKMTPKDMAAVADKYGMDNTVRYIRKMEGMLLKRG